MIWRLFKKNNKMWQINWGQKESSSKIESILASFVETCQMLKLKRSLKRRYFSDAEIKPSSPGANNTTSNQISPLCLTNTDSSKPGETKSPSISTRSISISSRFRHPLSKSFSISSTSSRSSTTLNSEPNAKASSISTANKILKPAKDWMKKFKVIRI